MKPVVLNRYAEDGELREPTDMLFVRQKRWDGNSPFSFEDISYVSPEALDVLFDGIRDRVQELTRDVSEDIAKLLRVWQGEEASSSAEHPPTATAPLEFFPDAHRYTPYRLAERLTQRLSGLLQVDYPLADPILIETRRLMLEDQDNRLISQEPYVESTPQYVQHKGSFDTLGLSAEAAAFFTALSETPRDYDPEARLLWPGLYSHQAESLQAFGVEGQSLVVSTGTGSGKTECFLLPMLLQLFEEARLNPNGFQRRGMRAIILYPMNALVNDQMSRLRLLFGSVAFTKLFKKHTGQDRHPTFGCYTGRTPYPGPRSASRDKEDVGTMLEHYIHLDEGIRDKLRALGRCPAKDLEKFFAAQHHETYMKDGKERNRFHWDRRLLTDPQDREYLTRHEMIPTAGGQGNPPDILVTNYSMLEYMLTRPWERPLFEVSRDRLVAGGADFLLVLDEAHMYRGSKGAEVGLLVRRLANRLGLRRQENQLKVICTSASLGDPAKARATGQNFAADLTGKQPHHFQVVSSQQVRFATSQPSSGLKSDIDTLASIDLAALHEATDGESLSSALSPLLGLLGLPENYQLEDDLWRDVHRALKEKSYIHALLEATSGKAIPFSALSERIFHVAGKDEAVSCLLTLGTLARSAPDAAGLVPARVHLMFRGLNGLYGCINPVCCGRQHAPGAKAPAGRLFAEPRDRCDHCESRVLEMLSCQNCGAAFFQAYHSEENLGSLDYLWGESEENAAPLQFAPGALPDAGYALAVPMAVDKRSGFIRGSHVESQSQVLLNLPAREGVRLREFARCPYCQSMEHSAQAKIRSFRTVGEEPFTTLIETQFAEQPPTNPGTANKGRKVLIFSDGRQRAARLAPAIESHHLSTAFRQTAILSLKFAQNALGQNQVSIAHIFPAMMKFCADRGLPLFPEDEQFKMASDRARSLSLRDCIDYLGAPFQDFSKALRHHLCHRFASLHSLGLAKVVWPSHAASSLSGLNLELSSKEQVVLMELWLKSQLESRRFHPRGVSLQEFDVTVRPQGMNLTSPSDLVSQRFQRFVSHLLGEKALSTFLGWTRDLVANSGLFLLLDDKYFLDDRLMALEPRVDDGWLSCTSCGRLFAETLRGCCSACQGEVAGAQASYLRARTGFYRDQVIRAMTENSFEPFGLVTAEHSAQLSGSDFGKDPHTRTEIAEMRFQDLPILDRLGRPLPPVDILSCTTTMEVGIDIGNLTGVALRNVPPGVANYQQRAGRAGRRGRALASVLTYAHGNTHDEHYFRRPADIISGSVPEPSVYIENQRILERHVNAEILRLYFEQNLTESSSSSLFTSLGKVEQFLGTETTPCLHHFSAWCRDHRAAISESLLVWLPTYSFHRSAPIEVIQVAEDASDFLLRRLLHELPVDLLRRREILTTSEREALEFVLGEDLLKFLIDVAILPRYAFPTDVVSFWVPSLHRVDGRTTFDYAPQRDLKIALSEYAPGASITLNKMRFVSAGFFSPYDPEPRALLEKCEIYFSCDRCGFVATRTHQDPLACPCCGAVEIVGTPMIRPKGFTPDSRTRPDRDSGGAVLSAGYATPAQLEVGEVAQWDQRLFDGRAQLLSRSQHLVVVNKGLKQKGFDVCPDCGRAEPSLPRKGRRRDLGQARSKKHFHPVEGTVCGGKSLGPYFLGHKFPTDVLLIRLAFKKPFRCSILSEDENSGRSGLTSIVEALCLVASRILQIDEGELSGNWAPVVGSHGEFADIFFYDELPGGAGYSMLFGDNLERVIRETLLVLRACNCQKSCYGCIRHYRNRSVHTALDRNLAIDLLTYILDGTIPQADPVEVRRDLEVLTSQAFGDAALSCKGPLSFCVERSQSKVDLVVHHPYVSQTTYADLQLSSYLLRSAPPTAWNLIKRQMSKQADSRVKETLQATSTSLDLVDPLCRSLLVKLLDLPVEEPQIGYEVIGPNGRVGTELEIAFPGRKVGLTLEDDESHDWLADQGWRIYTLETAEKMVEALT